jgi:anti-sigma regulatory factor (Ser/Thr protein kinase)
LIPTADQPQEHQQERPPRPDAFQHEALLYSGREEFLDGTMPFIEEALLGDRGVLVATDADNIALLRAYLGRSAAEVEFLEMGSAGRNPARILPIWTEFRDRCEADGRGASGIGEPIWFGRSSAEVVECQYHESLLNLAFEDGPGWELLCPYDAERLAEPVLEAARRSHPYLTGASRGSPSEEFEHVSNVLPLSSALSEPRETVHELEFEGRDLGLVREFVRHAGEVAGLERSRVEDLILAVSELAANSVRHGGGNGSLRVWREPSAVVCEVRDAGLIDEPLVGRIKPSHEQIGGRGLWIVNHLCDLVELRSSEDGTVVRVRMDLG